ncbi:MAG TPA: septal ring lytic transglycosylase RlpA family protein [Thermoanaerobaculia bacterium]|nr:septal ring lytic transglycosylase RlpA family protein [Thermoanaerobaculia bacterium]
MKRHSVQIFENKPAQRRLPVWAVPAVLLATYMGVAITSPEPSSLSAALERAAGASLHGIASWYGPGFHGRPTASGEPFDMDDLTAAHPTLPLGSRAQVTNLDNGRTVVVRINDRGPFFGNRTIDLSRAAAREIGMLAAGSAKVEVTPLDG